MSYIKNIGLYLYTFFLLLGNGSVTFGVKFGNQITVIVFFVSIVVAIIAGRIYKKNIIKFSIIAGLFLLVNLLNLSSGVDWESGLLFLGQLFIICIIQSYYDSADLHRCIVNCMFVICVISLITFLLRETGSSIFNPFIMEEKIHGSSYTYIYSFWHTFGWNVDFHRNAGPFWEAGMFACFIAIALCFLVFEENLLNTKKTKLYFITFIITIVSTMSTTGYIMLVIFALFYFVKQPFETKKQFVLKLFLGIFIVAAVILLLKSSVIQEKLFTNNSSIMKRTANITGGIKLIQEQPLIGLGFRSNLSRKLEIVYGAGSAANGIIQGCYRMGIILFGILLAYYKRALNIIMNKRQAFFTFLIYLLLMFGEPIQIFTVFLSLIFLRKTNNVRNICEENRNE